VVLAGLTRLRRAVRRYGVAGAARRLLALATETVYLRQEHVWYELDLHGERPRRELDPDFTLLCAGPEDIPLLDELWAIDHAEAERRLQSGGTLWLVLERRRPAFSCWTFRDKTPIRAAQKGWLDLPAGVACLEESMTAAAYRGRSIAPAAWTLIADRLASQQLSRLVTTIEEENAASRTAVAKVGFVEIGRAETVKTGNRVRVHLKSGERDGNAAFLRRLERDR
jgi:RimJ/RimL family protein N-acetyltransferase